MFSLTWWLQIITLTLPVLISGLILILVLKSNYLGFFDKPLDHGILINKVRLFGDNKTYRGVFVFVAISIATSYFLYLFYTKGAEQAIHSIFNQSPMLIGLIYSLSYTFGELMNSAIKRQLDIPPGMTVKSKFRITQQFFDLSDGIIAVAIALVLFTSVTIFQAIIAVVMGIGLHLSTDLLMQKLRLK